MNKLFVILLLSFSISASAQWVNVPNGLIPTQIIYSLASSGNNVLAGYWADLYISTNDGASWAVTLSNKGGNVFVTEGSNVFVGTIYGVYLSKNYGIDWRLLGLSNESIMALAKKGNTIFAGSLNGVSISTNNGTNWSHTTLYWDKDVTCLLVKDNFIFAGIFEYPYIWRSSNNGTTWDTLSLGIPGYGFPICLMTKDNNIFVGTKEFGILVSSNNGLNWAQTGLDSTSVYCLLVNNNNIIAGTIYTSPCVCLSTDDGVSWINKNEGMGFRNIWALTTNNKYIFSGTESSVWRRSITEVGGQIIIPPVVPSAYSLSQNYPNPFNPKTKISYAIPNSGLVKLVVFDALGRKVQTLVNESLQPKTYETTFDGSNYPSGVYFYKLVTEGFKETKRMLLIK